MQRTFRGENMRQAVADVKAAFGEEATILRTSRGRDEGGVFIEIVAEGPGQAQSEQPPARGGVRGASAAYARQAHGGPPKQPPKSAPFAGRARWLAEQVETRQKPSSAPPKASAVGDDDLGSLRAEMKALRAMVTAMSETRRPDPNEGLRDSLDQLASDFGVLRQRLDSPSSQAEALATRLSALGFTTADAQRLSLLAAELGPGRACSPEQTRTRLERALAEELRCTGDPLPKVGQRRILAFVGPTGVGKTTTIAKVAARAQLMAGIKVALVTVDTFRMAAVEQLARYADILECPLHVVKTPEALPQVLESLKDIELVLVDSTGRSPRDEAQVNALARFFPPGWGGETVLTVAASTREADLMATVDAFARLDVRALCVTKLDETDAHGTVHAVARRAGQPLVWTTDGQRVPEDIELVDSVRLAKRLAAAALDDDAFESAG